MPPSGSENVDSVPVTPVPPVGFAPELSRSGGHVERQPPVHFRSEVVSPCRWYRVKPRESTSTVPTPGTFLLLTTRVAAPPLAPGDGDPPEAAPFDLPQAARTNTA